VFKLFRQYQEELEYKILSHYAVKSKESKGRKTPEPDCDIRTVFQRDRDRILHSKAFRRLKHKTQVFLAPEGDHYRTRLTHTLEVSQISRTIARALRLNEDLTEAISLGHDLGHTPFGHNGEDILNKLLSHGFRHYEQSLRVVDLLEKHNGNNGLNLTDEVRDGIYNHTGDKKPYTLEAQIIKISDRIAYLNHDIDDAKRAGIVNISKIPKEIFEVLGETHGERINTMIKDVIYNSLDKPVIAMSQHIQEATDQLREFMFENVYFNDIAKSEDRKAEKIMTDLFHYYMDSTSEIASKEDLVIYSKEEIVRDYIAGMTDRFALKQFRDIFLPLPWDK
jgi:dGTPase